MVFLIGCDHRAAQTYPESSDLDNPQNRIQREFRLLLIRAIEKHHPSLIAEEYHPEFLKRLRQNSVAVEVASEVNITHRFCDPSLENKNISSPNGPSAKSSGSANWERTSTRTFSLSLAQVIGRPCEDDSSEERLK